MTSSAKASSPPTPAADPGVQLFVFLPPALYDELCDRSEDDETTLAAVMRAALTEYLKSPS